MSAWRISWPAIFFSVLIWSGINPKDFITWVLEVMPALVAIAFYVPDSGMVIYRSKPHATLKRNYQLMPAIKWLRLLMNHIADRHEHLVRYYGYYSNRARGARRLIENGDGAAESVRVDEPPADTRRKTNWARLIQKVYEVDPLECASCGSNMRIIALIDDVDVIERILKHLKVWDPQPDSGH